MYHQKDQISLLRVVSTEDLKYIMKLVIFIERKNFVSGTVLRLSPNQSLYRLFESKLKKHFQWFGSSSCI